MSKEACLIPWSIRFLRSKKKAYLVMISGWIIVLLLLGWLAFEVLNKPFTSVDFLKLGLSSGTILSAIMLFFVLLFVEPLNVPKYVEKKLHPFMKLHDETDREFARKSFKAEVQEAKQRTIANTKTQNFALFVILTALLQVVIIFWDLL